MFELVNKVVPSAFAKALQPAIDSFRIIFITAPSGWGKTFSVKALLRYRAHLYLNLQDEPLPQIALQDVELVVLDDCFVLHDRTELRQEILSLLRCVPSDHCLLLISRGPLPEWLAPFRDANLLTCMDASYFALNADEIGTMLSHMGLSTSHVDQLRIQTETAGYPPAVELVGKRLLEGQMLSDETIALAWQDLVGFFDRQFYAQWGTKTKRLLLSTALFDSFSAELVQFITGDVNAQNALENVLYTTGLLNRTDSIYSFAFPTVQRYLRQKAFAVYQEWGVRAIYTCAGVFYQLTEDIPAALKYYSMCGDDARAAELLADPLNRCWQCGTSREIWNTFRHLPEESIHAFPTLLYGMSLLCAQRLDMDGAKRWRNELRQFADELPVTNPLLQEANEFLSCLDFYLPQGQIGMQKRLPNSMQNGLFQFQNLCFTEGLPSLLRGCRCFSNPRCTERCVADMQKVMPDRNWTGVLELVQAERHYEQGKNVISDLLPITALKLDTPVQFVLVALLAWVNCWCGTINQALQSVTVFRKQAQDGMNELLPAVDALLCRLHLLTDDKSADFWHTKIAPDESEFFASERYEYLTKIRTYLSRREFTAALALAEQLLRFAEVFHHTLEGIEALILQSIALWHIEGGNWQKPLQNAIAAAQPFEYVMLFAQEGAALLPLLTHVKWEDDSDFFSLLLQKTQQIADLYPRYLSGNLRRSPL